jgi:hypothetical protein
MPPSKPHAPTSVGNWQSCYDSEAVTVSGEAGEGGAAMAGAWPLRQLAPLRPSDRDPRFASVGEMEVDRIDQITS